MAQYHKQEIAGKLWLLFCFMSVIDTWSRTHQRNMYITLDAKVQLGLLPDSVTKSRVRLGVQSFPIQMSLHLILRVTTL